MSGGVAGIINSLAESECVQVFQEFVGVRVGVVLQVKVEVTEKDEGAGVEHQWGDEVHNSV